MAPKRAKPQSYVDLTLDEDEDYLEETRPKRRRTAANRQKASDASGADAGAGPGPSTAVAGPTSPLPSAGKTARGRKKAASNAEPEERRVDERGSAVKYRPKASQDVLARIGRAMPGSAHRMFLVDSRQLAPVGAPGGPAQEFHVLGATGNVYEVRVSRQPRCSCPDFRKGHLCKHILFVMLRVLRQQPDNPLIWQSALLTREVEQVLAPLTTAAAAAAAGGGGAGPSAAAGAGAAAGGGLAAGLVDQSVLASELVRQRYAAITGGGGAAAAGGVGAGAGAAAGAAGGAAAGGAAGGAAGTVQRPVEGDCPICYEEMVAGGREAITFCRSCGNNMHTDCVKRWADSKRGQTVTCVYCRAPWTTNNNTNNPGGAAGGRAGRAAAAASGAGADGEAASPYVNLSQYSDAHRQEASLEELYGDNALFIRAHAGQMGLRQAARMHAAARGWV
ncbi:hypothetical protein Agub_g6637 [Astrephomene gubernaculifera]|uniref:Uncharacterized protein n=1 Tax=Astrephomene gubernaculifera TaxID=47775 RepID=A0AAD3DNP4_9CHLO|nr:hypothetical protein Agub_g6637 [Astrephomene gubernaculifera]